MKGWFMRSRWLQAWVLYLLLEYLFYKLLYEAKTDYCNENISRMFLTGTNNLLQIVYKYLHLSVCSGSLKKTPSFASNIYRVSTSLEVIAQCSIEISSNLTASWFCEITNRLNKNCKGTQSFMIASNDEKLDTNVTCRMISWRASKFS